MTNAGIVSVDEPSLKVLGELGGVGKRSPEPNPAVRVSKEYSFTWIS